MKFIEMTGRVLAEIINDGELREDDLHSAGVHDETLVRINQQGDIEVRRAHGWDCIGGLLGNYGDRIRHKTGLDWA
ncbi:MAG: hypothetical protein KDA71_04600 [Planctomycetales bacterium]|nr:hypothetical protein [Planctomycetales bacterium]